MYGNRRNDNISEQTVSSWKFHNRINNRNTILVTGNKDKNYKIGEVIVFSVQESNVPIIHRIIAVHNVNGQIFYETKGDHNDGQHAYEKLIAKDHVLGKASLRIPYVGWIKLFFVGIFSGKF